jgi:acetolactate synthase-1/2/3 large subunit
MKLSDYIINFIAAKGVKQVFLLTGGGAMHLNDSLGASKSVRYVCCLHEQACAIAAEAYAKYDNRLGVVMVTVGPGATNTITGVCGAWLDSTPMLFLSGQVKRADLKGNSGVRNRGVQEIDIVSLVKPVTKYAVLVDDPNSIRYHLEKAVHLAFHKRPGPVWLDIPLDVQASSIDPLRQKGYEIKSQYSREEDRNLAKKVKKTVKLLNQAERPFLLFGNGIRISGARKEFLRTINKLGIPFGLTWPAMDLVPDGHPLLVGRPGPIAPRGVNFALQNSDFLLMVGARMDLVLTAFSPERLARSAKKVMVDIDKNEIAKIGHIIDVPVCADARRFLKKLLTQSGTRKNKKLDLWRKRCEKWRKKYPILLAEHRLRKKPISMFYFTEILSKALAPGDLIVPGSSGNAIETLLLAFKTKTNQRIFITTGLGPMGFGLPASIGACLAHKGRRTVCVDGDGGFQMNIQELETLARLKLPVKIFVINNGGYGSIVASQKAYFGRLTGADASSGVTLPAVIKIAQAYGLSTFSIGSQENLFSKIERILKHPGPVVCDVKVVPDEPRNPRVSSMQRPDGTMVSRPLEDMYPFLDRKEFLENMIIQPVKEE